VVQERFQLSPKSDERRWGSDGWWKTVPSSELRLLKTIPGLLGGRSQNLDVSQSSEEVVDCQRQLAESTVLSAAGEVALFDSIIFKFWLPQSLCSVSFFLQYGKILVVCCRSSGFMHYVYSSISLHATMPCSPRQTVVTLRHLIMFCYCWLVMLSPLVLLSLFKGKVSGSRPGSLPVWVGGISRLQGELGPRIGGLELLEQRLSKRFSRSNSSLAWMKCPHWCLFPYSMWEGWSAVYTWIMSEITFHYITSCVT